MVEEFLTMCFLLIGAFVFSKGRWTKETVVFGGEEEEDDGDFL